MDPTPILSIEEPEEAQDSQMTDNDLSDEDSQMSDTSPVSEAEVKPTSQLRPFSGDRFQDSQEMQEWLSATAIVIDEECIFATRVLSAACVEDGVADQEPIEEDDDHASTILAAESNRSPPRNATTATSTADFSITDGTDDGYETDTNARTAAILDDDDSYDFAVPERTPGDRSSSEDEGDFLNLTLWGYDSTTIFELDAWSARYNIPPRIARELRWILRNNEYTGIKLGSDGMFVQHDEDVSQA